MHSALFSVGSSPGPAGAKVLLSSNSLPSATPRFRLAAMVLSMDGTSDVRITDVSSPSGLRMTTVFSRASSTARPSASIHLGLMKE